MREVTHDAASSPSNSPNCHCLVNIHNGSRTSARRLRVKSSVRGRGSNRLKATTRAMRKIGSLLTTSASNNFGFGIAGSEPGLLDVKGVQRCKVQNPHEV